VSGNDCGVFIDWYHRVDWETSCKLSGLASGSLGICKIKRQQARWILRFEGAWPLRSCYNVRADLQRGVEEGFCSVRRSRQQQQDSGHDFEGTVLGCGCPVWSAATYRRFSAAQKDLQNELQH
jgi:hypothetical protein